MSKNRIFLLLILIPLFLLNLFSQNITIDVFVHNHKTYAPLDSALVTVLRDGVILTSSYTGVDGKAQLTDTPTGVKETKSGLPNTFVVSENYPNPFTGETRVDFSISESQTVGADVFNIVGQRVMSQTLPLSAGYYTMNLSLPHLSTGIYFLRFRGMEQQAIKLMKVGSDVHYNTGLLSRGSIRVTSRSGVGLPLEKTTTEDEEFTIQVEKERYEAWSITEQIESDTHLTVPLVLLAEHLLTDIDGNVYQTVKIGDQWWMAENIRVTRYRNGDAIPTNLDNTQWRNTTSGAYAIYPHGDAAGIDSDEEMVDAYGKLYNWYAAVDNRGLCPEGWHVPSDGDWTTLVNYVVAQGYPDTNVVGGAGNALKSRRQENSPLGAPWATSEHPRWDYPHSTHHGLDVFGFSGLPGGYRASFGSYYNVGNYGYWWSSTEYDTNGAWLRYLGYYTGSVYSYANNRRIGFSVRCLRDF